MLPDTMIDASTPLPAELTKGSSPSMPAGAQKKAAGLERNLQQVLREGNEAVGEALELAEKHHNSLRQVPIFRTSL